MRGISSITVILVIIVICIFGVSVLRIVQPLDYFYKFQDTQRKADLARIQKALETYYKDYGQYPLSTANNNHPCAGDNLIKDRNPNTKDLEPVVWGAKWFSYMDQLPKDLNWNKCYVYYVSPTRQSYWLYASLDRGSKDPQACNMQNNHCDNMIGNGLTGACKNSGKGEQYNCNYGVSSANEAL